MYSYFILVMIPLHFSYLLTGPLEFPEPQLKDLVLIEVDRWYDLGLQLSLKYSCLDAIKSTNKGTTADCRRDMFHTWLQTQENPSYHQLVRALVAMGEQKEAKQLCEKYGESLPPTHWWYCYTNHCFICCLQVPNIMQL